jgi:hypothetical protein
MTSLQILPKLQRDWARSETCSETAGISRVRAGAFGLGVIHAMKNGGSNLRRRRHLQTPVRGASSYGPLRRLCDMLGLDPQL